MGIASVRQLHLVQRNTIWWNTSLDPGTKLAYYWHMFTAFVRSASTHKMRINYLGNSMHYDNFATPLSLQAYPHEITHSILSNAAGQKLKNVLDIGGNIGQFSLTLSHVLEDAAKIDILEPNSEIFELLKKNTHGKKNIRTFNYGVGKKGTQHIFYTPGKSATGSVFKSNTTNHTKAKKTKISMVNDISKLTGRSKYDLVKIDVEGYEYQLLEAIKPFKAKLMFIEVSLGRYKDFNHSKLFKLIEKKFGKFDIVHLSGGNSTSNNFDVMLKFVDA